MRRKFMALATAVVAAGAALFSVHPADASVPPLLNLFQDANFSGSVVAQAQATNCGTVGPSARQEFWVPWPQRLQGSSLEVITTSPYCNVMGVHAFGGNWYYICTMNTRRWYGDYGIAWFGNSANNWYNDNVDVMMVGYFYGCPLTN